MNSLEFEKWCAKHTARFGDGVAKQLASEGATTVWFEALKTVPFDLADAASQRMFEDESLQPQGWHKHPGRIKSIAWTIQGERDTQEARENVSFVEGERVYSCPHCLDSGFVLDVVAPKYIRDFHEGRVNVLEVERVVGGATQFSTVLVPSCTRFTLACLCGRGDGVNKERHWAQGGHSPLSKGKRKLITFDPDRMYRSTASGAGLVKELERMEVL